MTLKRSGFARAMLARTPSTVATMSKRAGLGQRLTPARAAVMAHCVAMSAPVPKEDALRHDGYRRLVASLPCIHCGIRQYSQCAHGNLGKGGAIKTDDRYSFPLCTVHPDSSGALVQGCHERFDQHALFSKAARRLIEPTWAADTRRRILAMNAWPKGLPLWSEA